MAELFAAMTELFASMTEQFAAMAEQFAARRLRRLGGEKAGKVSTCAPRHDALPRIRGLFRADAIELIAQGRQAKQRCCLNAQHDGA